MVELIPPTPAEPDDKITAGELRMYGIGIADDIPDCGWIYRKDLDLQVSSVDIDPETAKYMMHIALYFLAPFQWVSIKTEIRL